MSRTFNWRVAHPFLTDTDEHHQNSGAIFRSYPLLPVQFGCPILSPKEGKKDGAPDLPGMTASLIGKGGPPGRAGSSWNKLELFLKRHGFSRAARFPVGQRL